MAFSIFAEIPSEPVALFASREGMRSRTWSSVHRYSIGKFDEVRHWSDHGQSVTVKVHVVKGDEEVLFKNVGFFLSHHKLGQFWVHGEWE